MFVFSCKNKINADSCFVAPEPEQDLTRTLETRQEL